MNRSRGQEGVKPSGIGGGSGLSRVGCSGVLGFRLLVVGCGPMDRHLLLTGELIGC